MLAEALEAEVQAYIEAATEHRDEQGRALVVRTGYAREREILLGAGAVELKAPRVNDRRVDEDGNRRLCMVFRVGTLYPPSRSSSVPRRDSRPLVSPALQSNGRPSGSDS